MRSLTLVGSGWHPPLFRAEIMALLGPIEILHPRIAFVTQDESSLQSIKRAALVDDCLRDSARLWDPQGLDEREISNHVAEWAESRVPPGSFSVRVRRLGTALEGLSRRKIESETGALIASETRTVDLDDPENEVVVLIAGPEDASSHWDDAQTTSLVVWGLRDETSTGAYKGKPPTERPFFKPVTLDPRLARLMVSLAHRPGRTPTAIVDPFCGTGGIAIEASLLGMQALASDLDPEMVEGTTTNLQRANGEGAYSVELCSAEEIHELWGDRPGSSFVFDPPYGRNAWTSGDGLSILMGALSSALRMSPDGSVCTMLPTSPEALSGPLSGNQIVLGRDWDEIREMIGETGWSVVHSAPVRVHRSLSRLVVVCHPSD